MPSNMTEAYRSYCELAYPDGIPDAQDNQFYEAFMAGALVAFKAVQDAGKCPDEQRARLLLFHLMTQVAEFGRARHAEMQSRKKA